MSPIERMQSGLPNCGGRRAGWLTSRQAGPTPHRQLSSHSHSHSTSHSPPVALPAALQLVIVELVAPGFTGCSAFLWRLAPGDGHKKGRGDGRSNRGRQERCEIQQTLQPSEAHAARLACLKDPPRSCCQRPTDAPSRPRFTKPLTHTQHGQTQLPPQCQPCFTQ